MSEINSVAGQLVGIPVGQVYTAGPGIKIDNVHKVVSVDETVLYEISTGGSPTTSVTLSEAASNFERLRIVFGIDSSVVGSSHPTIQVMNDLYIRSGFTSYQLGATLYNIGSSNPLQIIAAEISINGSSITVVNGMRRWFGANAGDTAKPYIYKIVGINRIAGGN